MREDVCIYLYTHDCKKDKQKLTVDFEFEFVLLAE